MKKICKWISYILFLAIFVISIIKIIYLIKKYSLIEVIMGAGKLNKDGVGVVEISKNGTKFLTKLEDGQTVFKDYLSSLGYKYIGQFGSSNLYEYEGVEIVVKRCNLFGRYLLFEVFNEEYFREKNEYLPN